MLPAFQISATGLQAQQGHLDLIAGNLANLQTPGYKRVRASFIEVVQSLRTSPSSGVDSEPVPTLSLGVRLADGVRSFDPGELKKTDSPLDIAIRGDAFFEVFREEGPRAFTRGGSLKVNSEGLLTTADGTPLKPRLQVPAGMQALSVSSSGMVTAEVQQGQRRTMVALGELELHRFPNPEGLVAEGQGVFLSGAAAGEPIRLRPGEVGAATVLQGFFEGSNVRLVDEMVSLMLAQRAYEANAKVLQASDEMAGLVNGLRR